MALNLGLWFSFRSFRVWLNLICSHPAAENILIDVNVFPSILFYFFLSHSWSQPLPLSLLGLQRVSSVAYKHGGCRPSCGVTSLRGMLCVRGVRGGGEVLRDTKPTKTEPHLGPITAASPAHAVYFIKVHRCVPHLHTFSFPLIFTCRLSVVTFSHVTHICSYMLFFSHCLVWEGVMLTAKRFSLYVDCSRTEVKQVVGAGYDRAAPFEFSCC